MKYLLWIIFVVLVACFAYCFCEAPKLSNQSAIIYGPAGDSSTVLKVYGPTTYFFNVDFVIVKEKKPKACPDKNRDIKGVVAKDTPVMTAESCLAESFNMKDIVAKDTPIVFAADTSIYGYTIHSPTANYSKTLEAVKLILPGVLQLIVLLIVTKYVVQAFEKGKDKSKQKTETDLFTHEVKHILIHAQKCKYNIERVKKSERLPISLFFRKMIIDESALTMSHEAARLLYKEKNVTREQKRLRRFNRRAKQFPWLKKIRRKHAKSASDLEKYETKLARKENNNNTPGGNNTQTKKTSDFLENYLSFRLTLRNINKEFECMCKLLDDDFPNRGVYSKILHLILRKLKHVEEKGEALLISYGVYDLKIPKKVPEDWPIPFKDEDDRFLSDNEIQSEKSKSSNSPLNYYSFFQKVFKFLQG